MVKVTGCQANQSTSIKGRGESEESAAMYAF